MSGTLWLILIVGGGVFLWPKIRDNASLARTIARGLLLPVGWLFARWGDADSVGAIAALRAKAAAWIAGPAAKVAATVTAPGAVVTADLVTHAGFVTLFQPDGSELCRLPVTPPAVPPGGAT